MPPQWSTAAKRCFSVLAQEGYVVVAATETVQYGNNNRLEVTLILGDDNTKDEGK